MSTIIEKLEKAQLKRVPHFDPGDRVRVHFQVIEGTRRRTQVFEGVVIKRQGSGVRETFTVRKQSFGVGVERTFPVHSTKIEKIEVAARGEVRRAKLYYLRDRVGKRARVRERAWTPQEQARLDAEAKAAYEAEAPEGAFDAQGSQEEAEVVPADETPTDEVATDEAVAEEAAAEDTPAADAEAAPEAEAPAAEEAPAEEVPAEEAPAEEAPAEEAPAAEAEAEAAADGEAEPPAAEAEAEAAAEDADAS